MIDRKNEYFVSVDGSKLEVRCCADDKLMSSTSLKTITSVAIIECIDDTHLLLIRGFHDSKSSIEVWCFNGDDASSLAHLYTSQVSEYNAWIANQTLISERVDSCKFVADVYEINSTHLKKKGELNADHCLRVLIWDKLIHCDRPGSPSLRLYSVNYPGRLVGELVYEVEGGDAEWYNDPQHFVIKFHSDESSWLIPIVYESDGTKAARIISRTNVKQLGYRNVSNRQLDERCCSNRPMDSIEFAGRGTDISVWTRRDSVPYRLPHPTNLIGGLKINNIENFFKYDGIIIGVACSWNNWRRSFVEFDIDNPVLKLSPITYRTDLTAFPLRSRRQIVETYTPLLSTYTPLYKDLISLVVEYLQWR